MSLGIGGSSRTRGLVAAGVVVGALAAGVVARCPAAAAATTIQIDAGYAGTYVPGQPVPVRVRVTADRLLATDLSVAVDGPSTLVPVEVPGGSQKEFLVVVPTAAVNKQATVTVQLPDGSRTPPAATAAIRPVADEEVVGLLPGALSGRAVPGPAPLSVDVGTARFVALGPAELDRAPDSLHALGTIAVGADELVRVAPAVRTGLLRWTEAGGHLLVDANPGTSVPGLPDSWQPGANGRAPAGTGEVRLTAGAVAAGRWAGLVEPTRRLIGADIRPIGGPPLADSLANDAGFRLPELSWLVSFLAIYVLAVGPGLYLFLRRRGRPEMAWVVIPVVAILFTGASYAGGRGLRQSTSVVHGSVVATGAHGSTANTWIGVSSRGGGNVRLAYPEGWLPGGGDGDPVRPSRLTGVRLTAAGVEGRLPLDAGQFGMVAASGPSGMSGAVEVSARSEVDGQARGTIRNATDLHFDGAAVFVGFAAVSVGPLEPGEQREWSLNVAFRGENPEFQLWRPGPADQPSFTNIALWDLAQRAGVVTRDAGQAVGVGWTTAYHPPVRVGSNDGRADGRTLVLGTARVAAAGERMSDATVQRETVRSGGAGSSVLRFRLPDQERTIDAERLRLRSPIFPVDVWTGEAWTSLNCSDASCRPVRPGGVAPPQLRCPPNVPCPEIAPAPARGGSGEVVLPAGAVHDGAVYVRFAGGFAPGPFGPGPFGDQMIGIREVV